MQISGYRIDRIIGQGGMAIVYRAEQEALHRPVALKVMREEYAADTEFAGRFLDEGRTAARLNDPQIVTVHDTGVDNGHYYLAMEYLPGGSLQRRIREGLSLERALGIAERIGRGLAYAHSRNVIHCDIKPQNILFRASGEPVITDFGIARITSQSHPSNRNLASPLYMSPEQARSEPLDARSDLYSLGIILYEMLIGHPPYEAKDTLALAELHLHAEVPSLPARLAEFQPLIDHLLAKDPDQRYTITEQFLDALAQCQRNHWLNRHGGTMPIPALGDTIARPLMSDPESDATRQLPTSPTEPEDRPTEPIPARQPQADKLPKPAWRRKSQPPQPSQSGPRRARSRWRLPLAAVMLAGTGLAAYWWLWPHTETPPEPPPEPPRERIIFEQPDEPVEPPAPSISVDEPRPSLPAEITVDPADPPASEITEPTPPAPTPLPEPLSPPVTEPTPPPLSGSDLDTIRRLISNGDYERSLALLDRALDENIDSEALRDLRRQLRIQKILKEARERYAQEQLNDALILLDRGLRDFPDEPALSMLREHIDSELIEQRNRAQAETHLQRARELYRQARFDEALAEIEQGLVLLPRSAELRILRAQIRVDRDAFD